MMKKLKKIDLSEEANIRLINEAESDNFAYLQEDDLSEILGGYMCKRDFILNSEENHITCGCGFSFE